MKYFKPFYIGLALASIFSFCIISLSLIQPIKQISSNSKNNENYKQLFTNPSVDKYLISYNLNDLNEIEVIRTLTSVYNGILIFDDEKIEQKLMRLIYEKVNNKFKLNNNLFLNIKYQLKNKYELYIDARWANKNKIVKNLKTEIYYDNIYIKLSDNVL